jgi:hypothetical protein
LILNAEEVKPAGDEAKLVVTKACIMEGLAAVLGGVMGNLKVAVRVF